MMVLLTDGLFEARSPQDELFGRDRVLEALQQVRDKPAAAIADGLWQAVCGFVGGRPDHDDVTVAVIKPAPR